MNVTGNKAKVFWTGGWDSTFELCRLSLKPIQVQPVYIIMDRPYHTGQEYEIKTQDKLLSMLKERPTTKAEFLPLLRIKTKDLRMTDDIREAYNVYHNSLDKLGSQYYYFAMYANKHPGMRVMISDYHHSVSRTMRYIRQCNCQFDDERTMYILRKGSEKIPYSIFGKCFFPIADFDQTYILKWIEENQFWDIMKETWTCYYPINGKPCGFCHACNIKLKQHLDFLVGDDVKKRGFVFNYLCSKYEFSDPRLDLWFCAWLRTKYNPELKNYPVHADGITIFDKELKEYQNWYNRFWTERKQKEIAQYEPYFEKLLHSDIEYRDLRDRVQRAGLV